MDDFHQHVDQIYIVENVVENDGEEIIWGNSPMPLGPALMENTPQIEHAVRVELKDVKVYFDEKVFDELLYFADTSYFDLFTFPLKSGNASALKQPDGVVLSHEVAQKYFPEEEAMGKAITVGSGTQQKKVFTVMGVAAPFPENTGFRFDLLTGFDFLSSFDETETNDWASLSNGTFIKLKDGADISDIEKNMSEYITLHNAASDKREIKSFVFDNLKNPNEKAYDVIQRPAEAPHPHVATIFSVLALLMFILSCFNYINISLGQAANRLKEIGVRKVIGGKKRQLVLQFMSENILLCLIAVVIGLVITQTIVIPFFNSIMVTKISLSLVGNLKIWAFLLGLLAITGIVSGAYPAMYISSFKTVSIFRGKSSFSNKSKLTRIFLCLQFVLAFGTVIGSILFLSMSDHWKQQSWGYKPDHTLVVRLDEAGQFDLLKSEALRNPNVQQVGSATHHVGESVWRHQVFIGDKEMDAARFEVGAGYCEALGLAIKAGRSFDEFRKTEDGHSVVVNQKFLEENEWDSHVGHQIRSNGKTYDIAGVMDDFKIIVTGINKPVAFFLADEERLNYMAIRYKKGAGEQVESFMKSAWAKLVPGTPFSFFNQKMVFDNFFREFNSVSKALTYIAGLALLIACMGLFGLASQNYSNRLKESGIRKVLGATSQQIIFQANRSFIILLIIASLIATGICFGGFQLVTRQASDFMGEINLGVLPYLIANALVFVMACIAVVWQSYKLARVMPAETLRSE